MKKKLIKLGLATSIVTTSLFGFTYEIKQGWQQLGAIKDFDVLKPFDDASCVEYLWHYDLDEPVEADKWKLHISDGKTYNYCGKTFDSLDKGDGFWLKASGECNITVTEPNNCNTSGFPTPPSLDGSTCDANVTNPDNNISYDGANNSSEESAIPPIKNYTNTIGDITISTSTITSNGPYNAFDERGGSYIWGVSLEGEPEWLKVDFYNTIIINKYQIKPHVSGPGNAPKKWILQGSNDDVTWIDLDTRENETTWTPGAFNTYTFINSTSYRYYRLYMSESNNIHGALEIDQFNLIKAQ